MDINDEHIPKIKKDKSYIRYKRLKRKISAFKNHKDEKLLLFGLVYKDLNLVKHFVEDKDLAISSQDLLSFFIAVVVEETSTAGYILSRINLDDLKPRQKDRLYHAFIYSGVQNNIFLLKVFLNDSRFDPSINNNSMFRTTYESYLDGVANAEVVTLLLDDPRIWNKLTPSEKQEFYVFTAKGG